ncbi:hypothetical protein K3495_g1860 [Podosphaera aphanis]|nr:hypothetical protein K3495_g1860 [Podosphaera aphanis]
MARSQCHKGLAAVLYGPRDLRIEHRTLSAPESEEVQVAVQETGLCGSDLHYFNQYRNGDIMVREPIILGHESAGVVTEVGSAVTKLSIGDRVALEVGVACSKCDLCSADRYNICKGMKFRSSAKAFPHFQGTLQERINHPAALCHKLPENVTLEMGAMLEPLSVAIHASRRALLKQGATVLVFGAGAIGLLCAAMSKYYGAKTVIIADIQSDRVYFAMRNGFADRKIIVPKKRPQGIDDQLQFAKDVAESVKDISEVGEVDAVFECTGVESCVQAAIYSTRPGGCVMLVGMGTPIMTLPISAAALREVDIRGTFRYASTYREAIELVSLPNNLFPDLSILITHKIKGFDKIPAAFSMAGRIKDDLDQLVLKVVVETASG